MMVKNEEGELRACLGQIRDLFRQVIVVDTGSVDGTPDELRSLGIEPIFLRLAPARCSSHADIRNWGFARLQTSWVLTLDADERVSPQVLHELLRDQDRDAHGLLCPWINWLSPAESFEDYKCVLFRSGVRMRGLIHDNAQVDLRLRGLRSEWEERLVIHHHPDQSKVRAKRLAYARRLACAMRLEPEWLRYRWFWGYTLFRMNKVEAAAKELEVLHQSRSRLFPVECLNASMVLADCHARRGRQSSATSVLQRTLEFHDEVQEDFEVQINFRLRPWLVGALAASVSGDLHQVRAYDFAF